MISVPIAGCTTGDRCERALRPSPPMARTRRGRRLRSCKGWQQGMPSGGGTIIVAAGLPCAHQRAERSSDAAGKPGTAGQDTDRPPMAVGASRRFFFKREKCKGKSRTTTRPLREGRQADAGKGAALQIGCGFRLRPTIARPKFGGGGGVTSRLRIGSRRMVETAQQETVVFEQDLPEGRGPGRRSANRTTALGRKPRGLGDFHDAYGRPGERAMGARRFDGDAADRLRSAK